MKVRELLFELGFNDKAATRNAKRFDGVVTRLKKNVVRLGIVAGATAVALGAAALKAGNDYEDMSNKLRLVTDGHEDLKKAQDGVFAASQRSRSSLQATTDLFFGFSKASERFGFSQERILRITETTAKLATLSGNDPASTGAALFQLRQGILSGTLRGQELNSVLEQATPVADAIAAGMGIPFSEIRKQAELGKITGLSVLNALESQAGKTDEEFARMNRTARQARQQFKNAFGFFAGNVASGGDAVQAQIDFWDALKDIVSSAAFRDSLTFALKSVTALIRLASTAAKTLSSAISAVGGLQSAFQLLVSAIMAFITVSTVRAFPAIALWAWYMWGVTASAIAASGGFWALAASVAAATWPILLIIGAVTALTLLFDDLWSYFTDGESVIIPGLIKAWGTLQDTIGVFFTKIREWGSSFSDWFMGLLDPVLFAIEKVKNGFKGISASKLNPANWFGGNDNDTSQVVGNTISKIGTGGGLNQNNVFNPQVNINVPPGTMKEQVDFMDTRFKGMMLDYNKSQMRTALNNFTEVE